MTYNPAIPGASDLISQSQSQIQTNFSQANTAFGIDHTAFDVLTNQGKHKKSTYVEQAADPVTSANEAAIYTKDVAAVTTTFLRKENSGTVIATSGQDPIRASTGSTFLPGDSTRAIVMKWGDCGTVTSGGTAVAFTTGGGTNFPNACFQVFLTVYQNGSATTRTVNVDGASVSSTGFTAYATNSVNARYLAIGN